LHSYVLGLSLLHWVDDAQMTDFLSLVGLEIKREMRDGQFSTWSRRHRTKILREYRLRQFIRSSTNAANWARWVCRG
jgi:hypothetical protein